MIDWLWKMNDNSKLFKVVAIMLVCILIFKNSLFSAHLFHGYFKPNRFEIWLVGAFHSNTVHSLINSLEHLSPSQNYDACDLNVCLFFPFSACTGARLSLLFPLCWWRRSSVRHWPAFRQTCQVSAQSCHKCHKQP